jgi:hypothetical protein
MWSNARNKFVLSPIYGGASKPVFDSTWIGLATSHIGDRPSYYLEITANITDQDGLENIKKIAVTGPKGNIYSLNTISPTDKIKATYSCVTPVDSVPSSGAYVFTATDFDVNIVTITRQHTAAPLAYLPVDSISLGHNNEAKLPVSLYWTPIAGAARYQVDIFNAYGNSRLKTYANISSPNFSIPDNDLEAKKSYRYRISASDQNGYNFNNSQLYWNLCPIFHLTSEPPACTATLNANLQIHIPVLAYLNPWWGSPAYWADFVYEYKSAYPELILFKMTNVAKITVPTFDCSISTLSDDYNIHIPDLRLADGITHLWVDMAYSSAFSSEQTTLFLVTNYGIVSN